MPKTPSIISTIITVILLLLIGAVSMFMTLVALNGFNDSSGGPALVAALVCNGIGIILAALLAWFLPRLLIGKFNLNSILAVIISVVTGVVFGGGLSFAAIMVGAIVAESIWNAR